LQLRRMVLLGHSDLAVSIHHLIASTRRRALLKLVLLAMLLSRDSVIK